MRGRKRNAREGSDRAGCPVRRAFTLLELLVVLFIISLLAAILLPSLARAMRQASDTVCKHNLKEIYQALQIYRIDNDGHIPISSAEATSAADSWFGKLSPRYLGDSHLLRCPDDVHPVAFNEYGEPLVDSSYGLSDFIQSSPDGYLAHIERHQPKRPLDTLLLADVGPDIVVGVPINPAEAWMSHRVLGRLPWDDSFDAGEHAPAVPWLTTRHLGGINTVTIGGMVRRVRTQEMMQHTINNFYPDCAGGECPLCLDFQIPHYSFAHAQLFWWTGAVPDQPNPGRFTD
jgi:prepilin-type N-terminal cleavage/methylation domain-containing protein